MSTKAKNVVNAWIKNFIPEDMPFGEIEKLSKAAQISSSTIRQIRSRGSVSAETILSIMIARGVSEDDLANIAQTEDAKFSKSLSEWNQLGNVLSDKQRQQLIKLAKFLLNDWKIK